MHPPLAACIITAEPALHRPCGTDTAIMSLENLPQNLLKSHDYDTREAEVWMHTYCS